MVAESDTTWKTQRVGHATVLFVSAVPYTPREPDIYRGLGATWN